METKNKNKALVILALVFLGIIALKSINEVGFIFSYLFSIVFPVIEGILIAFVLNIIMNVFEKRVFFKLKNSKKKFLRRAVRPLSLLSSFILALGVLTVLILVLIPEIRKTFMTVADKMPEYIESSRVYIVDLLQKFNIQSDFLNKLEIDWNKTISALQSYLISGSSQLINTTSNLASGIFSGITNFVVGVILAIYILLQKEQIISCIKKLISSLFSKRIYNNVKYVINIVSKSFKKFIVGQMTEAIILGVLCYFGMLILRLPYAEVVSVLIAVTALVPIVGAIVGEAISAFLILMVNPWSALIFLIFILILQLIEGNVIYPKVVGESVGLPGILVLCAVLIGGNIAGVSGAFFGVPVCSVIYTIINEKLLKKDINNKVVSDK